MEEDLTSEDLCFLHNYVGLIRRKSIFTDGIHIHRSHLNGNNLHIHKSQAIHRLHSNASAAITYLDSTRTHRSHAHIYFNAFVNTLYFLHYSILAMNGSFQSISGQARRLPNVI